MGNHNSSSRNELRSNKKVSIRTDNTKTMRKTPMRILMNMTKAVEVKMMTQVVLRVAITMMTMMKITMMIVKWTIVRKIEDKGLKIE